MFKIYISGPMTGIEDFNRPEFMGLEKFLQEKHPDYIIFNPANQSLKPTWEEYMKYDLAEMLKCDCLIALEGYEYSRGAKIELDLARDLNLWVLFARKNGDGTYSLCIKKDDQLVEVA